VPEADALSEPETEGVTDRLPVALKVGEELRE
jgi:hypothetical protein